MTHFKDFVIWMFAGFAMSAWAFINVKVWTTFVGFTIWGMLGPIATGLVLPSFAIAAILNWNNRHG